MEEIEFNSLSELYNRLKPALKSKADEMHKFGYSYIKEEDVWNYLKEIRWSKSQDLNLYQMVNDVLTIDNTLVDNYLKGKLASKRRAIYITEEDLHGEED